MDFLITILAIIAGYYVLKYVLRLLMPRMFKYAAKKTEEHLKKKFDQFAEQNSGTTNPTSTYNTKKTDLKSNPSKKVGEYIDFEEIE